jgi:hypothetical protein
MKLKAKGVGLLLPLAFLAAGCVTAIRPYASDASAAPSASSLSTLEISVVGQDEGAVELAVDTLRRTRVFAMVSKGEDDHSDLGVTVRSSGDSIRCGTPQMATVLTLGLVPTGNVHHARLALEFSGHGAEPPVLIERDVYAETRHGLWALFLRAKKEWRRPDWGHDPAGLAIALREDILANEEQLVRLARRRAT